jgi:hypothetical protein
MSDEVRRRRLWSLGIAVIVAASIGPVVDARSHVAMRLPSAGVAAAAPCESLESRNESVATWYRLDPVLDAEGALAGQRLLAGRLEGAGTLDLELGPEAFASGPTDGWLVVGSDDGHRSTVRIIDAASSCEIASVATTDVVRRAVLDSDGGSIYEHRVDRRTRASLGVWRRPIDDLGRDRRVLGPLPPNERVGLVFATELVWSTDGRTLAVLSCGEVACVTRLLDVASGNATTIDDDRVGETLGIAGGRVVAYGQCHGLPCPVIAFDPNTRAVRRLARSAGLARVVDRIDGAAVAFEDPADGSLRIVDVDGRERLDISPFWDGMRIVPPAHVAMAGLDVERGWLALGPDGRPGGGSRSDWRLIDVDDGQALPATEVIP